MNGFWVRILVLQRTSCATLGKPLNLYDLQYFFFHLKMGIITHWYILN